MARGYVKAWTDWLEKMERLSDASKGRLLTAILVYAKTGDELPLKGNEAILWPVFKAEIDRDNEDRQRQAQANRLNGAKGGRPVVVQNPMGYEQTQHDTVGYVQNPKNRMGEEKEEENEKESIPPIIPPRGDVGVLDADGFDEFWMAYPKKQSKATAVRAWRRVPKGERPAIMAALEKHKALPQWTRDGGQYIPLAATWLNQKRWEDDLSIAGAGAPQAPPSARPKGFAQREYTEADFKDLYVDLTQYGEE